MESPFSRVDGGTPPVVTVPRRYNAAVDFVDRHSSSDKVALIDDFGPTTYRELAERTAAVTALVRALGVAPEQRVMLCLLDTADFAAIFFGTMRAGAVPVPVNTLLVTADYRFMLADSRARVLFVSDALWPKLEPAVADLPVRVVIVRSPTGGPDGGHPHLDALLAGPGEPSETTADDVAFWLYTSGSTGTPKGAVHLHSHLVHTAALYARGVLGVRPDDVIFSAAKLFFAYGLGNALTFALHAGATSVLLAERPTPAAVLRTLKTHAPTLFFGVPTLYAAILADPSLASETGSARLRLCVSAGEALPKHVGERWTARFGTEVLDGIGSTEMLHIFLSNRPGAVRYGTTGQPVPGYELELRDDDGRPGDEGALWVNGPSCCVAYWNQRARSLATFQGGWTRTGDRYRRDADGYYTYVGRDDDMLKVGGIWVSPFEVESALAAHPAVLEVAVVGSPDPEGLIKPRAFAVLKPGHVGSQALAAELKAFVKDRIATFKAPKWIDFVPELPKTATGKIQRFRLR